MDSLAMPSVVLARNSACREDHIDTANRFPCRFATVVIRQSGAKGVPLQKWSFYSHFDYKVWGAHTFSEVAMYSTASQCEKDRKSPFLVLHSDKIGSQVWE